MKQFANNMTALEHSQEIVCKERWAVISVTGTLDTETLTVQASPDGGNNWFTYRSDDPTGTPEAAVIAAADVSSGIFTRIFVAGDQRLRLLMSNNAGSPSSVDCYCGGVGVEVVKSSTQGT